jgi:hypothetical protein
VIFCSGAEKRSGVHIWITKIFVINEPAHGLIRPAGLLV